MKKRLDITLRFIRFWFQAKTKYNIHSPFVFRFVENVLEDDRNFYVFGQTKRLRTELEKSNETVEITDLGAGSHIQGTQKTRRVADILRSSVSPNFQCAWLFRICNLYKPLNIIELGTSLGISTLHLAEGSPHKSTIYTLEGAENIAKIARRNFDWYFDTFKNIGLRHTKGYPSVSESADDEKNKIQIVVGNFDNTLPEILEKIQKIDLAYIDGNHRYAPTMRYFEQCLEYAHPDTVLIFDDIYWSDEMLKAWEDIKQHPKVRLSIDLFWFGLVFFRSENVEKEHFKIMSAQWKPFSWGFFG